MHTANSDFIWDFGKLPFPTHLGKYFIKIGKIRAKIHEIGKIKAIFGLGMTPIYGLKNGQIISLAKHNIFFIALFLLNLFYLSKPRLDCSKTNLILIRSYCIKQLTMRQTATYIKRGKSIDPSCSELNLPSTWDVTTKYTANNFRRCYFQMCLLVLQWVTVQTLIKCHQM